MEEKRTSILPPINASGNKTPTQLDERFDDDADFMPSIIDPNDKISGKPQLIETHSAKTNIMKQSTLPLTRIWSKNRIAQDFNGMELEEESYSGRTNDP